MMRSWRRGWLLALCALCLLMTGCASHSYAVLMPSPDGSVGAIVVTNDKGSTLVNRRQQAVPLDGSAAQIFDVPERQMQTDFSAAQAAQPALPVYFQVYFKTGNTSLTPESDAFIPIVLKTIHERGGIAAVSITGHTDTVGDQASNEQLGLTRAQAIARLLQLNGLKALELIVTSHGERNLLVKTPDNTAEPRNRRVEINIR